MIKDSDVEAGSFIQETGSENCHSLTVAEVLIQVIATPTQCVLTCGLGNCSSSITRELVRNANSPPHPRPTEQKLWEWGPAICVLTSPAGYSDGR